jgi:antitoxin HicB
MKFTVILQPEAEGGYSIQMPALPGVVTQGESIDQALDNVREASELWLEVRAEDGLPIPVETPEIVAREIEFCLKWRSEEGLPLTIETREVEIGAGVAA